LKAPRAKAPTIGPFGSPIKGKKKAVVSQSRWMSGAWREVAMAAN